jgi:hypothetical protein
MQIVVGCRLLESLHAVSVGVCLHNAPNANSMCTCYSSPTASRDKQ